jgi:DNA-binding response OmpR family regulator
MKRILYIEDNAPTQMVVRKHLSQVGEISVGSSLAEGRQLLQEGAFDLLLSDVFLPDGTAFELVHEIRRRFSPQQFPVILVSSAMDQLLRVRSFQAGANDCFSIPTAWPVLVEAVERMMRQPYVGSSGVDAAAVTWIEGRDDRGFWLFCPELKECLSGDNLDALRDTMAERVRQTTAGGRALPFISHVQVSEHLVKTARD